MVCIVVSGFVIVVSGFFAVVATEMIDVKTSVVGPAASLVVDFVVVAIAHAKMLIQIVRNMFVRLSFIK